MSVNLFRSVGTFGVNHREDVRLIQRLLNLHGVNAGPVDGLCGPLTVHAILRYQSHFLQKPDGRVDPQGLTFRRLSGHHAKKPITHDVLRQTQTPPKAPSTPTSIAKPASPPAVASTNKPLSQNQSLTTLIPKPKLGTVNIGLISPKASYLVKKLGNPRDNYTDICQPMQNRKLLANLVTASVGPFRATGLIPAINSLRTALDEVKVEQPAVYNALSTPGMLCCRKTRGAESPSVHSWGIAVDLKLNGLLDDRGDNFVQLGLSLMAPIMNKHGWYWGGGYKGKEDAMHFEASTSLVEIWASQLK
jgi:peptidoglycan hydrolase-like protein with peptidoglycan-binding domain